MSYVVENNKSGILKEVDDVKTMVLNELENKTNTLTRVKEQHINSNEEFQAFKKLRTSTNSYTKELKGNMKELKQRLIHEILGDTEDQIEDIADISVEIVGELDTKINGWIELLDAERSKLVEDEFIRVCGGYEIPYSDDMLGLLHSKVYTLSSSLKSVTEVVLETVSLLKQDLDVFDITADEYSKYNYSASRYSAYLKDEMAKLKPKPEPVVTNNVPTMQPLKVEATTRVVLNEKLATKVTATGRNTFANEFAKVQKQYDALLEAMEIEKHSEIEMLLRESL
jgi:hypothetical protein